MTRLPRLLPALGVLSALLALGVCWWRGPVTEPQDWPDGMCPNCVTPWKCNGPHLAFGETPDPSWRDLERVDAV